MYADVILPLPLSNLYTYAIPSAMEGGIAIGCRVLVPFGRGRFYTAVVVKVHNDAPNGFKVKEIYSQVDTNPVVLEHQLELWEWISFYYMSNIGDVYNCATPSTLKSNNLEQNYKAKTETYYFINEKHSTEERKALFGRSKKQVQLYESIAERLKESSIEKISKKDISELNGYSEYALRQLISKEIIKSEAVEITRLDGDKLPTSEPIKLADNEQKAFDEIVEQFEHKNAILLQGDAFIDKTNIYIHLIKETINSGKQALYLLPEISLTGQLTDHLVSVFGSDIGIYHSGIDDNERAEIWLKMISDKPYKVILGTRSAIFLPYKELGMVIIDEEQDSSYKQQDPAPRYNARDAGVLLVGMFGGKALLGSDTPSMESCRNTRTGKYGLVKLHNKADSICMPKIVIEDVFDLRKRRKMKTILSPRLTEEMENAIARDKQVVLFRNRRGYSTVVECSQCAWVPKCKRCDVTLTYYKNENVLECHYCNAKYRLPEECPSCHSHEIDKFGKGTEQIEEKVKELFPMARVDRLDYDTSRGKRAYERIVDEFERGETDILIGTQMISNIWNFSNVGVVGILSADSLLNYPDFRSKERGFQLMWQIAGQLGRKNEESVVVVQTNNAEVNVYEHLVSHDYEAFVREELNERKMFNYPPFCKLIRIILKDKNEALVEKAAQIVADRLRGKFGDKVNGPTHGVVCRVQSYYNQEILLKLEIGSSMTDTRKILRKAEAVVKSYDSMKYVRIYYDVDPM
ncbi:MAG: replication restart helicase PriA [Fermentimonas sp.]|jgi:primosomal protein N' (replication factor Y)